MKPFVALVSSFEPLSNVAKNFISGAAGAIKHGTLKHALKFYCIRITISHQRLRLRGDLTTLIFCPLSITTRDRIPQNDVTLPVANSNFSIKTLLSSY